MSDRMSAMLRVASEETSAPVRRYQRRTSIKSVTVNSPTNWHVAGSHRGAACISFDLKKEAREIESVFEISQRATIARRNHTEGTCRNTSGIF